jgi:hypothetical protein
MAEDLAAHIPGGLQDGLPVHPSLKSAFFTDDELLLESRPRGVRLRGPFLVRRKP